MLQRIPTEIRFWRLVDKRGVDECWNWKGYVNRERMNYAYISVPTEKHRVRKQVSAHRFSWELANGRKIPEGLVVMHRCDNGSCVNPNHLRVGTQKENNWDAINKGRLIPGTPRISAELIISVFLESQKTGESLNAVADRYALDREVIRRVKVGDRRPEVHNKLKELGLI